MASSNWKELLKSQNEEINRLEAVDHDLDSNLMLNLNDEINQIIKKKSFVLPPPSSSTTIDDDNGGNNGLNNEGIHFLS
jgi:hypothetical protein